MKLSRRRLWLRLSAGALVALALVIAFLPTALGSRWIYQPVINRLAADDFQLHVTGVQFRWLSALRLRGVEVRQRGGPVLVSIAEIKTDRGLLGYLLGGRRMGRIEIIDPVVDVQLLKDESNLQLFVKALDGATRQSEASQRSRPPIDIQVVVRGLSAKVRRESEAQPLIVIPPLNLDVMYRAASANSRLIVAPTTILDRVELTPELVELGLDYAVPLLASSAWFDGRVSLSLGAIDVPLDTPVRTSGEAQLTLHQVRSGPSNPSIIKVLDFIAAARQVEPQHEIVFVDGSQVLITISDARVHHSGLKMGLPKMDSRLQLATSGSVGLEDRSLDLLIDLPVPLEQLALREQVQKLGVPTLRLPVGGTLDDPQVRWDAMRGDAGQLLGLMREQIATESPATAAVLGALGGLAEGKADEAIAGAVDLIEQLRQRRQRAAEQSKEKQQVQPDEDDAAKDQPPRKRQPVRDAFRDLFRQRDN